MARDRYERRHRATAANSGCVEAMASADFGAVPSLSEAMGLEGPALRVNDLVTFYGWLVGRVEYIERGWAGVRQGSRVDEYPLGQLQLAR